MNYIGSKFKLSKFIKSEIKKVVGEIKDKVFCDLFAGTGAIGRVFKAESKKVIANDFEYYAYVLNQNYIGNHEKLNYQDLIDELNQTEGVAGFIYNNYCLGSGSERQYFSDENGKKIDAIRQKIKNWKNENRINENEYYFLLTSLLENADSVANTASVYGAFFEIEKFLMELAWRDYFQNVWIATGEEINDDLKQSQPDVKNSSLPRAVLHAEIEIEAIDNGINDLYETGYVHNHQRMYIASVVTNIGKSHWKIPAQWFYYHLLDADWASNALSWQWTCAAFSNKKYYANQENINKYCATNQRGTFLDVPYEDFPDLEIPASLQELEMPILQTTLPKKEAITVDNELPTLVYNFYNLDPFWKNDVSANRVLLLEPSHFEKYPVSPKTIEFVLKLTENIERIQIYVGEFDELKAEYNLDEIYYKEHPTNANYTGTQETANFA